MRSKRKMETVRIRKANATIKKEKIVCFAQDRDVSTCILAILSVGQTKSGVKKETKGADGKVTVAFVPEITRYKVICGSNGKVGTRYNVIKIPSKKDIKESIKSAISENPSFKQFLEENHAYDKYVKNVTNQILRSRDISDKLIKCVHKIAHSNYSNGEIINSTISWSSTSEGSDYWFRLYFNTKK